MPRVSVIIPFHGVEAWIEECLLGVLAQEERDIEILAVDDASPDGSRAIVERLAAADPRLRILTHATNQGLGPARNTAIAEARGDHLFFFDSDDRMSDPGALGALLARARETGCQVVAGSCERLLPDGTLHPFDRQHDEWMGGAPGESRSGLAAYRAAMLLPGGGYIPMRGCGTLIERRFFQSLGLPFPPGEHEDMAVTPLLYHQANQVFYEGRIVFHYRDRAGSISRSAWPEAKLRRYGLLWAEIRARMVRFGLAGEIGDAALKIAEHLVWKLEQNGLAPGAEPALRQVLTGILDDSATARNAAQLEALLAAMRRPELAPLAALLPRGLLIERLRREVTALGGTPPEGEEAALGLALVAAARARLEEARREAAAQAARAAEAEARLRAMQASSFWRATAPARRIVAALRALR